MSKRVIVGLIVFMVLVMTSLILVQTNSIMQALAIKGEQFNDAVNSALVKVAYQLEMEEASAFAEYAKDITMQRRSGFFPSNSKQSISGSLNLKGSKFSYEFLQRSTGRIRHEEIVINYKDGVPDADSNDRGRPGDFPNAFDIFHESDGFASQQYEERLDVRAGMFLFQSRKVLLSQFPIADRIVLSILGLFISTK